MLWGCILKALLAAKFLFSNKLSLKTLSLGQKDEAICILLEVFSLLL